MSDPRKPRSWQVTEGPQRAPARARCSAPSGSPRRTSASRRSAVASSWNEVTPCNYHLDKLAALAKEGVRQGDAVPIEFTTIAISDGIAMGHEGMKASPDVPRSDRRLRRARHARRADGRPRRHRRLRQVRARHAHGDGAAWTCRPSSSTAARSSPAPTRAATSRSRTSSRPWARTRRARSTDDELLAIERAACPGTGSCAGMYTANTMAAAAEALGMSLPGAASPPAVDYRREVFARESGIAAARLLADGGPTPRRIMTKQAFENAIAVTMALAGSTNAVLHLLAIAHEARRRPRARRLRPDQPHRPAPRGRPARREVRDAGPGPGRRRAGRDEGAPRRGSAGRRLRDA